MAVTIVSRRLEIRVSNCPVIGIATNAPKAATSRTAPMSVPDAS